MEYFDLRRKRQVISFFFFIIVLLTTNVWFAVKTVNDYRVIPGEKVRGKDIWYVQKTGQWSLVFMFTVQPRCDKQQQL